MPGGKPLSEMTHPERASLYLEQAHAAWADGVLHRKERLMLDRLRERVGLSADDAPRLERDAVRS